MNTSSWSIITNFSCYCYNMCSIGYLLKEKEKSHKKKATVVCGRPDGS